MIIPHQQLAPDTLRAVIEEFITREGTDYGMQDYSLNDKVDQVLHLLDRGEAVLVYFEATDSCNILSREEAEKRYNTPDDE